MKNKQSNPGLFASQADPIQYPVLTKKNAHAPPPKKKMPTHTRLSKHRRVLQYQKRARIGAVVYLVSSTFAHQTLKHTGRSERQYCTDEEIVEYKCVLK